MGRFGAQYRLVADEEQALDSLLSLAVNRGDQAEDCDPRADLQDTLSAPVPAGSSDVRDWTGLWFRNRSEPSRRVRSSQKAEPGPQIRSRASEEIWFMRRYITKRTLTPSTNIER